MTGGTVSSSVQDSNNNASKVFLAGRTLVIGNLSVCTHEVTQEEYQTYCYYSGEYSPSESLGLGDKYPAYFVSWYDTLVYCNLRSKAENLTPVYSFSSETDPNKWSRIESSGGKYRGPSSSDSTIADWDAVEINSSADGYRLPTEAEWEYIARGGNDGNFEPYQYSGSNNLDDVAWYAGNSGDSTHELMQKQANTLGIYDMTGNVWEWCQDWYDSTLTDVDGSGPDLGTCRVERGGSWYNDETSQKYLSLHYRDLENQYSRLNRVGFRVVRTITE